MKKWNKRLILLLIVALTMGILVGCGKTPKAPDNFDKDLWEGSIKVTDIIRRTYESDNNFSVKDENAIKEYFEVYQKRLYSNEDEYKIINTIRDLYQNYEKYIYSKRVFSDWGFEVKHKEKVENIFGELKDMYDGLIK